VSRNFRKAVGFFLVAFILFGFGVSPNYVLCVDPGKHIAVEPIGDLCCAKHLPDLPGPAVQSSDTCTDTVLGVSTLRPAPNFFPATLSASLPSIALSVPLLTAEGIFVPRSKPPPLRILPLSIALLC
jgi:hypothetical protein